MCSCEEEKKEIDDLILETREGLMRLHFVKEERELTSLTKRSEIIELFQSIEKRENSDIEL